MWSSEPRALAARTCPHSRSHSLRPTRPCSHLRLRETLNTVLGNAGKEQWLQLRSILAKDQSLAEDALALIKTAFVTSQKRCNNIALLDIIACLALEDNAS